MTNNTNKPTTDSKRYNAYTVREFERNGAVDHDGMRVGVAFPHKDGKGFDVMLQAVPVDGKVVLRLHEPKDSSTQEQSAGIPTTGALAAPVSLCARQVALAWR